MHPVVPRLAWGGVAALGLYFAVQGGEFGTSDLLRQRGRRAALQASIDSLRAEVDSLEAYERALRTDRALQERIAREEFGMIREGELLYRLADLDSVERREPDAQVAVGR